MKKIIAILLTVVILCSFVSVSSLAISPESLSEYTKKAEVLKSLGLFLGTDVGFELERSTTRAEAAVMVVRLLGKAAEADTANLTHPFTDVPDWASDYVGYLYKNGISNGVADTQYGSTLIATPNQFGTFLLRVLGYSDAAGDFSWDASLQKMAQLGIITEDNSREYAGTSSLPRAYAAALLYSCLFAGENNGYNTLLERLYFADKAISNAQLISVIADPNIASLANLMGLSAPASGESLSESEVFERCHNAIFKTLMIDTNNILVGNGSGFFISPDGLAVTNYHVVKMSSSGTVQMPDGTSYNITGIIGFNYDYDLAIIKVDAKDVPCLTFGEKPKNGDTVYAIGSPKGVPDKISTGIVQQNRDFDENGLFIRSSNTVAPGSSGGALINKSGQVVGVTSAMAIADDMCLSVPITNLSMIYRTSPTLSLFYVYAHARYGSDRFISSYAFRETGDNNTAAAQTIVNATSMKGTISDSADVDVYKFTPGLNGTILVSLTSDIINSQILKYEIIDSYGKVLAIAKHYPGETLSTTMFRVEYDVSYTIKIYTSDENATAPVSYSLYYEVIPRTEEYIPISEFEPNDTQESANYLPNNYEFIASLGTNEDVDYYQMHVGFYNQASIVLYAADASVSNFSLTLISAETGKALSNTWTTGKYMVLDYENLKMGTYYIVVAAKSGLSSEAKTGQYYLFIDSAI